MHAATGEGLLVALVCCSNDRDWTVHGASPPHATSSLRVRRPPSRRPQTQRQSPAPPPTDTSQTRARSWSPHTPRSALRHCSQMTHQTMPPLGSTSSSEHSPARRSRMKCNREQCSDSRSRPRQPSERSCRYGKDEPSHGSKKHSIPFAQNCPRPQFTALHLRSEAPRGLSPSCGSPTWPDCPPKMPPILCVGQRARC